jgi:succinate-semialdehyde dehydrogenase/glutarate-semialdehyde dehydrogenase
MSFRSVNPANGNTLRVVDAFTPAQRDAALQGAVQAGMTWRDTGPGERAPLLRRAADVLRRHLNEYAELITGEMGKPIRESRAEIEKCAWVCEYYADAGPGFLEDENIASDAGRSLVAWQPLGTVLAIMPWNFPFWQLYRFAAPALMAGNVVVQKHAPNTPRCAKAIEGVMREAGLPDGVFQNLYLSNEQAARVIGDRRVRAVTLTGSTRAGREVASTAGRQLKPMVMELGGSDAFIVLDDADLEQAVATGVASRCLNNGQSCIAAKRFIVADAVFDQFRDRFVEAMGAREMGDPKREGTKLGPLAREDLRDQLAGQVRSAVAAGGRVLTGGRVPEGPGFFYPATVIVDLPLDSAAAGEELFGPAAVLVRGGTDDEVVVIANGTVYGLGASLWTADPERAQRIVPRLDAGAVFVNGLVKSDPRLPFGGVKDSGFGRELSREGILEFVNVKTVWIR